MHQERYEKPVFYMWGKWNTDVRQRRGSLSIPRILTNCQENREFKRKKLQAKDVSGQFVGKKREGHPTQQIKGIKNRIMLMNYAHENNYIESQI